ncbi:hypothetical protein M0802_009333 [Mischocyttarus mexicanus]|nr:hypothetical protein M0802_009333 [Mischocyttarus mexicanus]
MRNGSCAVLSRVKNGIGKPRRRESCWLVVDGGGGGGGSLGTRKGKVCLLEAEFLGLVNIHPQGYNVSRKFSSTIAPQSLPWNQVAASRFSLVKLLNSTTNRQVENRTYLGLLGRHTLLVN